MLCPSTAGGPELLFLFVRAGVLTAARLVAGKVERDDAESDRTRFVPARGSSAGLSGAGIGVIGMADSAWAMSWPAVEREALPVVRTFFFPFGILCLPPALSFRVTLRSLGDSMGVFVTWGVWDMM